MVDMTLPKNKTRFIVILACVAVAVVLVIAKFALQADASINVSIEGWEAQITIGEMDNGAPPGYGGERSSFLKTLAGSDPDGLYSAVVPLDDYYTEGEVTSLITSHDITVERIYMWAPGETGTLSLAVNDNDIEEAKKAFIAKMSGPLGDSEEIQNDLQRLIRGDFKIYALTIRGSARELEELSNTIPQFAAVDVKYNPEAEAYAQRRGIPFSYVELPSKPDGAY